MGVRRWTEAEVLEVCRKVLEEHGPDVGLRRACRISGLSESLIQSRVGGWLEVKRRLGYPLERQGPAVHRVHSREGLVLRLKELVARLGDDITLVQFCRETGTGPGTVRIYCENWSDLRRMAGLPRRRGRRPHFSDELLFSDLCRVRQMLGGKELTARDYERLGMACSDTLKRRFGPQWCQVLNAFGAFRRRMLKEYADVATAEKQVVAWIMELMQRNRMAPPAKEEVESRKDAG